MTLFSPVFFFFVVAAVGIYYLCPSRWRWIWLLAASVLFYGLAGGAVALASTLVMIGLVWLAARLMDQYCRYRRHIFAAGMACVLLMLVVYQYLGFFEITIHWIQRFLGLEQHSFLVKLATPLGISFYTFQLLGYLIDVYWESERPQHNFAKFCLYGLYFPYIASGPINRYGQLSPQLYAAHKFDYTQCCFGAQRILWGLFKKLVIAERLAVIVDLVYTNYGVYQGPYVWLGAACFGLQLYADFSGAMDIALGVSQCFGIQLPENFQTPFFSKTVSEFWRRWHITLGGWFRDYMLYPFLKTERISAWGRCLKKRYGKTWGKRIPIYVGLLFVWLSVGVWHGGSYKYICGIGLMMWCVIVGGELCSPLFHKMTTTLHIRKKSLGYHIFCSVRTFAIMCVSFVFFRSESFMEALRMLIASVRRPIAHLSVSTLASALQGMTELMVLAIGLLIAFALELLQYRLHENGLSLRAQIAQKPLWLRWIVYYAVIVMIIVWGYYGIDHPISQFIYQNF